MPKQAIKKQITHTPGPWRTVTDEDEDFVGAVVLTEGGTLVADCNIFGIDRPDEEMELNAALVAAAPDLYEALTIIIESATDGRECPEWLQERLTIARAALAKAEGRQ